MKKKAAFLRSVALLAAFLLVFYLISRNCQNQEELTAQNLRLLATTDPSRLADFLDRAIISIDAGDFLLGSDDGNPDERPQHIVYVDAFEMDRFEVTNTQYLRFLEAVGHNPPVYWLGGEYPPGQADFPVVGVSWQEADAYCRWAGKRLPTEAEWEKACRGPGGRSYPWGNTWDEGLANVYAVGPAFPETATTGSETTSRDFMWGALLDTPSPNGIGLRPVGSYPNAASPYGVMDMVGNASEWVADWYNWSDYSEMPLANPYGSGPAWNRCLRGSSWYDRGEDKHWIQEKSRCAARNSSHVPRDPRVGFRCAR